MPKDTPLTLFKVAQPGYDTYFPDGIWEKIFNYLDRFELTNLILTCHAFQQIIKNSPSNLVYIRAEFMLNRMDNLMRAQETLVKRDKAFLPSNLHTIKLGDTAIKYILNIYKRILPWLLETIRVHNAEVFFNTYGKLFSGETRLKKAVVILQENVSMLSISNNLSAQARLDLVKSIFFALKDLTLSPSLKNKDILLQRFLKIMLDDGPAYFDDNALDSFISMFSFESSIENCGIYM